LLHRHKLDGIEPDGFVAPSYAYTSALRQTLKGRFRWWAGLLRVHTAAGTAGLSPAWSFAGGPFGRALSPQLVRAGSLLSRTPCASTCTLPTSSTGVT
jgi:hypothetical protein